MGIRHMHIDCSSGISGDMFLAAAAGLGVDLKGLEEIFVRAGLDVGLEISGEKRCGIKGNRVSVRAGEEQPLRHLGDIEELVAGLECGREIRDRTVQAFRRLAEVEAGVHGVPVSEVHFHETGAVDSIVDIVGAFWALDSLGVSAVTCGSLPWFSGHVQCAHGILPLPAPATSELMRGKPVYPADLKYEAVTPTGALLVDRMVHSFRGPQGKMEKSGTGYGSKDEGGFNGLRLFLFTSGETDGEWIWVLESNVDHLSGEEIGVFIEDIQKSNALDVLYVPGVMKKNRAGGLLQVLALPEDVEEVKGAFFRQCMTLGVREQLVRRSILPRETEVRDTCWGAVKGKSFYLNGHWMWRPEMEDVREKAKSAGVPVAEFLNRIHAGS